MIADIFFSLSSLIELKFTYHTIYPVCINHCFLVYPHSSAAIATVLEHFLSPPKRNPTPNSSHFLISYFQALSPRQPQICFLSLQIYLFWIFHVNRIIQKVVFVTSFFHFAYSQRSSRLWHVLRLHSFLWPNTPLYGCATFYLSILQLTDFWVISILGILRRMLLWTLL